MNRILPWVGSLALLWTTACFQDSTSVPACSGDEGCECFPNDTCNDDLVCDQDRCVSAQCQNGREGCLCDDGRCLTGLACEDEICRSPAGTGTSSSSTSIATSTSDSGVDTGVTTNVSPSTGNTGGVSCQPGMDDGVCTLCLKTACCNEFAQCLSDGACDCWLECFESGLPENDCVTPCGPLTADVAPLSMCRETQCAGDCVVVDTTSTGTSTTGMSTTAVSTTGA